MFNKIQSKLDEQLKKINLFGSSEDNDGSQLSNQSLINQIEAHFKRGMERDSFDDQLIYDCNFLVLMRPEDYQKAELRLPQIVEGLVKRFYKIIQKKKVKYARYQPLGNYWYFQFCPQEQDPQNQTIEEGKVVIISTATSLKQDWGETLQQNLLSSELLNVSINGKHSKYSKYDLNLETLGGIDILEKGKMRLKFNSQLLFTDGDILKEEKKEIAAYARLSFEQNYSKKSYSIIGNYVEVGLAKRANEDSNASRLNIYEPNSALQQEHFAVRYDKESNTFYIALFAPAMINEERLKVSGDKSQPEWHRLKQKSSILCGMFQINFEALT